MSPKNSESHISAAANKKNFFAHVMGDVNESCSESDTIIVDSIKDFADSPHLINKKGYNFTIGKDPNNRYSQDWG